jgi:flagellar basal body-associated protein FliL
MDISDKLIIICIIFAILAILSIVFGCFYFSSKPENFKNKKSKEAFIIEKMIELFKNNSEDFKIIEMMKTYKEQFKNEKFVGKLINELTTAETTADFTNKKSKKSKK